MLCTLNHIKAPLVWAVCGLPLRDDRGRRKQISFLDLGPSFPSSLHPSSSLPFIWPLQGSAGRQHAPVVLHGGDIFRGDAHTGLTCIVGREVLRVQFIHEIHWSWMWSEWLPGRQMSGLWRVKESNLKLEKPEELKEERETLIASFESLQGRQHETRVNMRQ